MSYYPPAERQARGVCERCGGVVPVPAQVILPRTKFFPKFIAVDQDAAVTAIDRHRCFQ